MSPSILQTSNRLSAMGFARGASGMLEFPAGKCPASQARVKTWRVLPQTRPSPARCFCPSARLWGGNFTDELEFESKAGRKEPPASKELWVGSCRIGLGKWRALPELSDFIPITTSHCYFLGCSRIQSHTLAVGRVSTGT